jgi:hypothetical protein
VTFSIKSTIMTFIISTIFTIREDNRNSLMLKNKDMANMVNKESMVKTKSTSNLNNRNSAIIMKEVNG